MFVKHHGNQTTPDIKISSSNTKSWWKNLTFFCFNATCLLKITLQVNRSTRRCGKARGEGGDATWGKTPNKSTSQNYCQLGLRISCGHIWRHRYISRKKYYLYKYTYIYMNYINIKYPKTCHNFIQIEKHLEVEVVLHEGLHRNPLNSAQSGFDHLLVDNQQSWLQVPKNM